MTKPTAEALKKPYLLIDTANDTLSLAVIADGKVLSSFSEAVFRDMAARLQPEMQNVLQSAQMGWPELGGILFNQGPGSFTSIRIGLAAAKALELSLGLKVYGLNGMQALAHPHTGQGRDVTVLLEAVGTDIYTQSFDENGKPHADAITQSLPEALERAPVGSLFVGDTSNVNIEAKTATPMAFWQLFADGYAVFPAKAAYIRPLTYKKVANQ
jgi:tRNA threonylcarbamoyladenosine biosynthesis protein TsaB